VDILDLNGTTLSDQLNFYLAADGNAHVTFYSEGELITGTPIDGIREDATAFACLNCGTADNVYMVHSTPSVVPELSSLLLLGSVVLGLAGVFRSKLKT
jgi:hypothetical protein